MYHERYIILSSVRLILVLAYIFSPLQNLVHDPEVYRLLGVHKVITNHEFLNLLQTPLLGQVALVDLVQSLPHPQDLLRVIRNITSLP